MWEKLRDLEHKVSTLIASLVELEWYCCVVDLCMCLAYQVDLVCGRWIASDWGGCVVVQVEYASSIHHDNIVRLLDVFAEGRQLVLVVRRHSWLESAFLCLVTFAVHNWNS